MRWTEMLRRCTDFTKNNIVGLLFFSILTGVLGNFVYDAVKPKDPTQTASLGALPIAQRSPTIELAASPEKTARTTLKSEASPAQIPSASVAPVAAPNVAPSDPMSQRASRTQSSLASTAKSRDHDGTDEPAIPSPPNGIVSPPAAVLNRIPLDGINGSWRSASDAGCKYAIHIEVRDDLLLWSSPQAVDPLLFRVFKADATEISARWPDGRIAAFDVHTQSFLFKSERLEKPVEYVRCL